MNRKIRALVAKPGLDGHELGARLIARIFMDAGMEVIYTGPRQTSEMILNTAIQEDVDIIGLSFLGGSHKEHTVKITELMKKNGMSDVVLLAGGIIPTMDIDYLKSLGVDEVFGPGSDIDVIVKTTLELLKKKREGGH